MGCYVQTSTEQRDPYFKPVFLYPDEDDKWWVSDEPGKKSGWLYNPLSGKTPPSSGWKTNLMDDGWNDDTSVTVTNGSLPHLASQFMVSASGAAAEWLPSLGLFNRTERWLNGRPVYDNMDGWLLYHGSGGDGWMIGKQFRSGSLKGSRAHHSPASEGNWTYWDYWVWKPASVTVTEIERGILNSGGTTQVNEIYFGGYLDNTSTLPPIPRMPTTSPPTQGPHIPRQPTQGPPTPWPLAPRLPTYRPPTTRLSTPRPPSTRPPTTTLPTPWPLAPRLPTYRPPTLGPPGTRLPTTRQPGTRQLTNLEILKALYSQIQKTTPGPPNLSPPTPGPTTLRPSSTRLPGSRPHNPPPPPPLGGYGGSMDKRQKIIANTVTDSFLSSVYAVIGWHCKHHTLREIVDFTTTLTRGGTNFKMTLWLQSRIGINCSEVVEQICENIILHEPHPFSCSEHASKSNPLCLALVRPENIYCH